MANEPEREIHFHFHIGGADVSQLVAEVKAVNAALAKLEPKMAEIDDKLDATLTKINALKDHVTAETQQVLDKVTSFNATIDALTAERDRLQAIIDAGTPLTPEQQAKFDAINAALDEVATGVDNVDPSTPSVVPT